MTHASLLTADTHSFPYFEVSDEFLRAVAHIEEEEIGVPADTYLDALIDEFNR